MPIPDKTVGLYLIESVFRLDDNGADIWRLETTHSTLDSACAELLALEHTPRKHRIVKVVAVSPGEPMPPYSHRASRA